MNEVVANLAGARLAGRRVHPNDDVNRCQSSNDTIPTALQLSAAMAIETDLLPALERLHTALVAKEQAFWPVVKTGRTHLQDATPIRLGQEFRGYAGQVEESLRRARAAQAELLAVPLGGTAVGTGINAHPEYAFRACARLSTLTGLTVRETPNHFHAQATLDVAIAAHGAIRTIALSLWKIASDVRLMGMGPRAGLAELALPETQPGSSIMPGKVNPVIVESLTMVVARVVGNDATIAFGQTGSFLELNVMLPVSAAALLESIELLAAATANFSERCIEGLTATERGPQLVEQGLMLATALAPVIGYDEAAKLAKQAHASGRTIRELALERGLDAERARPAARSGIDDRTGSRRRIRGRLSQRAPERWPLAAPLRQAGRPPIVRPWLHVTTSRTPMAVHAPPNTSQAAVHGTSIATDPMTTSTPIGQSPSRTRTTPTSVAPIIARVCAAASVAPSVWPAAATASAAIQATNPTAVSADPTRIERPPVSPARSAQPSVATSSREAAAKRHKHDLSQVARPVRRDGLADDARGGDRPQAATDERRDRRHSRRRRRVQPGVERPAEQVEHVAPTARRTAEQRAHLLAVPRAPRPRVEADEPRSHVQPFSTRGGMMPGWPRATGNGPRATRPVSIVRTPRASTSMAYRSIPRCAGP